MPYPTELTTSDWVDYLATLTTRDEKIAALATCHRRVEHAATLKALTNLSVPDDAKAQTIVRAAVDVAIAEVAAPLDYDATT